MEEPRASRVLSTDRWQIGHLLDRRGHLLEENTTHI
jgi:hypothetical protein